MVGVADPAMWAEDGGPSWHSAWRTWRGVPQADNKRVARMGAIGGWDQLRARLVGDADGRPMLLCSSHLPRPDPDAAGDAARQWPGQRISIRKRKITWSTVYATRCYVTPLRQKAPKVVVMDSWARAFEQSGQQAQEWKTA
jgi:hypothetical protein